MSIPQDTFNKIVTLTLLVFFMAMYAWSFGTGKPLNLQSLAGFLIPVITHGSHLFYNFAGSKTSVNAAQSSVSPQQVAAMKEVITGVPAVQPANGGGH